MFDPFTIGPLSVKRSSKRQPTEAHSGQKRKSSAIVQV